MTKYHVDHRCGSNPAKLEEILHAFAGRRVLVVGDLMLDEYVWGRATRVSPEAPVLVVEAQRTSHNLGGAGNVAQNVQHLGGQAIVAGIVGADTGGDLVRASLESCGCRAEGLVRTALRPTTVKTRIVAQHQQLVRVDRETREPIEGPLLESLLGFLDEWIPQVDAVLLSDYAKGTLPDRLVTAAIQTASRCHRPVTANLKPPRIDPFRGATLLTLNLHEAERATQQSITDTATLHHCGRTLRHHLSCDALLITCGGDGVALYVADEEPLCFPAQRVQVFDVTGAGDTVISAATLALAAGATFAVAAALGNLAGNIKVTKLGTAAVGREEIGHFLSTYFSEGHPHEIPSPDGAWLRAAA